MSTSARLRAGVVTQSAEETRSIAAEWAKDVPEDTVVALHGDLGAGKTTWVQGMAVGLGVAGKVTSPTFMLYAIHKGTRATLVHLDAYRIGSQQEAEGLLLEEFLVRPWHLVIEWPERVPSLVSDGALHLEFEALPEGSRLIRLVDRPAWPNQV